MNRLNRFGHYLIVLVAVFASSFANADWYVKDKDLISAVNTMKASKSLADVITSVNKVSTYIGEGKDTDNVNTKLKEANENIGTLTKQFIFDKKSLPTFSATYYLNGANQDIEIETPVVNCEGNSAEDKSDTSGLGSSVSAAVSASVKAAKLALSTAAFASPSGPLNEACKQINTEIKAMYDERKAFNKQIKLLQNKINSYENEINPAYKITNGKIVASTATNGTALTTYAELSILAIQLQIVQASQANTIGIHASNVEMFKMKIQTAKEEYLRIAIKRLLFGTSK
jgi:hypothetical protein